MSLVRYLIIMSIATLICWAGWYTVVLLVNPWQTGVLGFSLFYISLGLALIGTFAVIGFFVRLFLLKQEMVFQKVVIAFRQAIFLALLVIGCLMLQSARLLVWSNVAFLIIGLTALEFLIISIRSGRHDRI